MLEEATGGPATIVPAQARASVDAWIEHNAGSVRRYLVVVDDIEAAGIESLATLSVALRDVRDLVPRSAALS